MKEYIFLTNIPTPYRNSFYNDLYACGLNFEVYYNRITESDRNWQFEEKEIRHPFHIDNGFYKMFGRYHLHFNPKLIIKIVKQKNAELIIGWNWNDINLIILVTLQKIGFIKNTFHFWSEANYLSIGARKDNILKKVIRKYVFDTSDGAQLSSGKMVEITLQKWKIKHKYFIPLPNIIEEEKFQISAEEEENRYKNIIPVFILPVRLTEKIKGIINFFKSIEVDNIKKGLFLIAGDGPDKENIQEFITSNGVDENIKILGHCDTEALVTLYKKANVFILPSYSDASPLTLIEALKMKLPVLVSDRCGNHYEAVSNERNGFLFNPSDSITIKRAFESILFRSNDWRNMGSISANIYDQNFNKQMVINTFINALQKFSTN